MIQDLRYAIRQLRKSPGFACTAIFVLGLGLAATVAIFVFVDAALLQPLPYRDPSRLVSVFETNPTGSEYPVSYLDYLDWKKFNNVFTSIDAYDLNGGFTLTTATGARLVYGTRVSAGFFRTLGVAPLLGRDFHPGEDSPSAPQTVLLSYATWQERFGGSRDVLGRTVTLNTLPYIVIGVLPQAFHFAPVGAAEFWTTLRNSGGTVHESNPCEQRRGCHNLATIARLKRGDSVQAALAEMRSIARQLEKAYPDSNRDQGANVLLLSDVIVGDIRPILLGLLSAAALLLLTACINVVSLLLARSDSRRREISVRMALGGSLARLFRQFATEALVLVAIAGFFAVISAQWAMQLLIHLIPADLLGGMPYLQVLGLTDRVVLFACAISLLAGVLLAITPAVRTSEMLDGLKEGTRGSAGTMWRRFGSNLVVVELALAMVLLVGAGLLGKSLYLLLDEDLGFNPGHLATLQIEGPFSSYSKRQQQIALERQIVARFDNLPGVKSAAVTNALPVGWTGTAWFRIAGRPYHGEHNEVIDRKVSSGYFTTLQVRLVRGRFFNEAEDSSKPGVVIINETLGKQYFPGENPIGKQIFYSTPPQPPMQIVGIVADIKEGPLDAAPRPAIYVPFNQSPSRFFSIVVRTSQAERAILPELVATLHQINPDISTYQEAAMSDKINGSPAAYLHRSSAWLVGSFAGIAFLLGIVGLYGVVAYSVSQRTREIGIRIALGAQPDSVYRLVLSEAAWLAIAGAALGAACSMATARIMQRLLFGISSWDLPTFTAVAVVLVTSALLASYLPARRAASVNPVEALRSE
jgi:predicted permease